MEKTGENGRAISSSSKDDVLEETHNGGTRNFDEEQSDGKDGKSLKSKIKEHSKVREKTSASLESMPPQPRLHRYDRYIVDPVKNPTLERTQPNFIPDEETQMEIFGDLGDGDLGDQGEQEIEVENKSDLKDDEEKESEDESKTAQKNGSEISN